MDHSHVQHGPVEKQRVKPFRARWAPDRIRRSRGVFSIHGAQAHLSGLAYYLPFLLVLACPLTSTPRRQNIVLPRAASTRASDIRYISGFSPFCWASFFSGQRS